MLPKHKIALYVVLILFVFGGIVFLVSCNGNQSLLYSQEYFAGSGNNKGDIETKTFSDISPDFEIGANQYGYAVFKNPDVAFTSLKTDYSAGLELIQEEFNLKPLSPSNYTAYKIYGLQVTTGTTNEKAQAHFISKFLDIYENSFKKDYVNPD